MPLNVDLRIEVVDFQCAFRIAHIRSALIEEDCFWLCHGFPLVGCVERYVRPIGYAALFFIGLGKLGVDRSAKGVPTQSRLRQQHDVARGREQPVRVFPADIRARAGLQASCHGTDFLRQRPAHMQRQGLNDFQHFLWRDQKAVAPAFGHRRVDQTEVLADVAGFATIEEGPHLDAGLQVLEGALVVEFAEETAGHVPRAVAADRAGHLLAGDVVEEMRSVAGIAENKLIPSDHLIDDLDEVFPHVVGVIEFFTQQKALIEAAALPWALQQVADEVFAVVVAARQTGAGSQ